MSTNVTLQQNNHVSEFFPWDGMMKHLSSLFGLNTSTITNDEMLRVRKLEHRLLHKTKRNGNKNANTDVDGLYTYREDAYFFQTHDPLLHSIMKHILTSRVLPKNKWTRDWNWGAWLGLTEFCVFGMLKRFAQLPPKMLKPGRYEHIRIPVSHGGVTCIHIYYPPDPKQNGISPKTPIVLLLPGLTSNQHMFITLIQTCVQIKGWIAVVANRRGLCEKLNTPMFHVLGCEDDLRLILEHIQAMSVLNGRNIIALGVSMGGNLLTRYLGKYCRPVDRDMDHIIAAASLCSPLNLGDLHIASPVIEHYLLTELKRSYINSYVELFTKQCKCTITAKMYHRLIRCKSVIEFVYLHLYLCKFQCSDSNANASKAIRKIIKSQQSLGVEALDEKELWSLAEEYDAARVASNINVPFLAITSQDDPVVRTSRSSHEALLKSSFLVHLHTLCGSHTLYRDHVLESNSNLNWAEMLLISWFDENLASSSYTSFLSPFTTTLKQTS